ncbi:hypothetical protein COCOBI_04-5830 [Coccomyxa sp. Obi]|nr:hypothetical protein COCOBI_04-5830 [Coccomyxa sp. Obi]
MDDREEKADADPQYSTFEQGHLARAAQQSHNMAINLTKNRELLAQLEAAEHENYEVAEYLREELESRDEQIAVFHARIEEAVAACSAEKRRSAMREENLRQAHAAATSGLHQEVADLRGQLAGLTEALAKRVAADDELVKLRTQVYYYYYYTFSSPYGLGTSSSTFMAALHSSRFLHFLRQLYGNPMASKSSLT